jgi:hypothetical protein
MLISFKNFIENNIYVVNCFGDIMTSQKYHIWLSPNIIDTTSNIDFQSIFKNTVNQFNTLYNSLEIFLKERKPSYRDIKVNSLSIDEYLYIKNNLSIDDDYIENNLLNNSVQITGNTFLRVYLLKQEFENTNHFKILEFEHSNFDTELKSYISIFLDSKFGENESDFVNLIYYLADTILTRNLIIAGIPINKDHDKDNIIRKFIVLPENHNMLPSDIIFFINYNITLFMCLINSTNQSLMTFDKVLEAKLPIIDYNNSDNNIMKSIWDLSKSSYNNFINDRNSKINTTTDEYIELASKLYKIILE